MEKIKNLALAVAVLGVVVLGVAFASQSSPTAEDVAKTLSKKIGALTGPDLPYEYFGFGNVRQWAYREDLSTATTSVCQIQSPNATTTLERFAVRFDVGSTSAKTIIMAKGTAMQASTTLLYSDALAANAKGTFTSSSTPAGVGNASVVIAPQNWLNVSMVGGTGTDSPSGSCVAVFQEV